MNPCYVETPQAPICRTWRRGPAAAFDGYRSDLTAEALERASRSSNLLLRSALQYAQQGWPVFRCEPGGKKPMFKGLTRASTDAFTVISWWESNPNANIGIATGEASGMVIVDPDGQVGLTNWAGLLAGHGVVTTRRVISGREDGGEHWYFRIPMGSTGWLKSDANVLAEGVDIRADGGYIIAPPSVHPGGAVYTWAQEDVPIIELPEWIRTIILSGRREASTTEEHFHISVNSAMEDLEAFTDGTAYGRYVLEVESKMLADTPEGGRDRAAYMTYRRIGQLVGSRQLAADKALRSLAWAMDRNGLGRAEAKIAAFESGLNDGIVNPVRPAVNPKANQTDAHEDPVADQGGLSEFVSFNHPKTNKTNSDITERPLPPSSFCAVAGGQNGDASGLYTDVLSLDRVLALTEAEMRCSFTASLVLADSANDLYVGRRRCRRRACRGCMYSGLREHLERLTQAVASEIGTWWHQRLPTKEWPTMHQSLLRQKLDFARVPAADAVAVFVFGPSQPRPGFDPLTSSEEFQALFAEAYQQLPPAAINSAQVTFSKRWTRPADKGKANLHRVGITGHESAMRQAAKDTGAEIKHAFDDFTKIIISGSDDAEAVLMAGRLRPPGRTPPTAAHDAPSSAAPSVRP